MIPQRFKKLNTLVLLAGPGSGSKLFQSYLDSHSQILMTPGYILMYFYPHWDNQLVKEKNWKKILNKFFELHPSILDSGKMKGGDFLYNLGKKRENKIQINKNKFSSKILEYLSGEKINSKFFFLAIHLAYASCLGENLSKKKILVYHMHVCWYLSRFYKDFKNTKTISMIRELKSNIPNRIINGIEKPNSIHLNPTDELFFKTRSYKNIIFEDFYTLDYLKKFSEKKHKVIKHEDLLTRKHHVIKNLCKYININFEKILYKSTANKFQWNYKHSKGVKLKDGVAEHIIHYDKSNFFTHELYWIDYLCLLFNKKYEYEFRKKKFLFFNSLLTLIFIFLPSRAELNLFINFFRITFVFDFFKKLFSELNKKKIILYERNAFYYYKWSNKYFPFSLINFLLKKIRSSPSFFWKLIYFLFKFCLFLTIPLFIIFEYLLRTLLCYGVFFKIMINKRFYPSKL